jgi:hypothetical protein
MIPSTSGADQSWPDRPGSAPGAGPLYPAVILATQSAAPGHLAVIGPALRRVASTFRHPHRARHLTGLCSMPSTFPPQRTRPRGYSESGIIDIRDLHFRLIFSLASPATITITGASQKGGMTKSFVCLTEWHKGLFETGVRRLHRGGNHHSHTASSGQFAALASGSWSAWCVYGQDRACIPCVLQGILRGGDNEYQHFAHTRHDRDLRGMAR